MADIVRGQRRADRDVTQTHVVKRVARQLSKRDAIAQLKLDSEHTRAVATSRHTARMRDVELETKRMLERVRQVDKAERQKVTESVAKHSGFAKTGNGFPYPVDQAQHSRAAQQRVDKETAKSMLVDAIAHNPDVTKVSLYTQIGRSRKTLYSYLDELCDENLILPDSSVRSGYRIANGQHSVVIPEAMADQAGE